MNYLFIGYYGHNNLGDEAILRAMVCYLQKKDPDPKFVTITSNINNSFLQMMI